MMATKQTHEFVVALLFLLMLPVPALAQGAASGFAEPTRHQETTGPSAWKRSTMRVGNVLPHLSVLADGTDSRSETGIGALIPWANRLWAVGYVAHIQGKGIGLYEIKEDLSMRLHPASVTGTFANRLVHWESEQVFIGPHAIDARGNVRTIEALTKLRLTATARHLKDPVHMVYFLSMEGPLFEVQVETLATTRVCDLTDELHLPTGATPHFKGAHTAQGRLVVANNTYDERDYLGQRAAGRLAEWDGHGAWKTVEENPFIEVAGKQNPATGATYGNTLYAVGWDRRSVILRVLHDRAWSRYRLPRGSHSWSHTWNTEWMRIREVQTERYLMDAFGIFYDLPALTYAGKVWGIRPIATHLRICPDMVSWRGLLVLAGDQTDNAVGQPQSGFWFGSIDDLWQWGKPSGWGAVWRDTPVAANEPSDPMLMTGFDKKVLHISHTASHTVDFTIEVDFLGDGHWNRYKRMRVAPSGYAFHTFPDGYSAHWVRVTANHNCTATAQFMYH